MSRRRPQRADGACARTARVCGEQVCTLERCSAEFWATREAREPGGVTLKHAYLVFDNSAAVVLASNPAPVTLGL